MILAMRKESTGLKALRFMSEGKVTSYARLVWALSLQLQRELLACDLTFSLEMDVSTHMAPS